MTPSGVPNTSSVCFMRIAYRNSAAAGAGPTITSVTDVRNTWTRVGTAVSNPSGVDTGIVVYLYYTFVAVPYQSGDTITIALSAATNGYAATIDQQMGFDPVLLPAADSGTTATANATTSPAVALTPAKAGDLVYVYVGSFGASGQFSTPDADTLDGSWVRLARATQTLLTYDGQYKIVTGTSTQNHQASYSTTVPSAAVGFTLPAGVYSTVPQGGIGFAFNTTVVRTAVGTGAAFNANAGITYINAFAGAATATGAANSPQQLRANASPLVRLATGTGSGYNATTTSTTPWVARVGETAGSAITNVAVTLTVPIPADRVLTLRVVAANSGGGGVARTIASVTDTKSNTWVRVNTINVDPGAADAGATSHLYYALTTTALTTSDTVNFSFSGAATQSVSTLDLWTNIETLTGLPTANTGVTGTGTTTATGTILVTPTTVGDVVVVLDGWFSATATYTGDADTLQGSWGSADQRTSGNWKSSLQHKTVTGTSQQSHASTFSVASPSASIGVRFPVRQPRTNIQAGLASGTGAISPSVLTAVPSALPQLASGIGTGYDASVATSTPATWTLHQATGMAVGGSNYADCGFVGGGMTANSKIIALCEVTRSNGLGYASTVLSVEATTDYPGHAGAHVANFDRVAVAVSNDGSNVTNEASIWVLDTPSALVGLQYPDWLVAGHFNAAIGGSGQSISLLEVSGLRVGPAVDGTPGTNSGYASALGPPSYASTAAGEFLVNAYFDWGSNVTLTGPAGYTLVGQNNNGSGVTLAAYKDSTGGTETGTYGNQVANAVRETIMVAFPLGLPGEIGAGFAAGTGSTGPPQPWLRRQAWAADFGATNTVSFALQTFKVAWGSKLVCLVTAANAGGSPGCVSVDDGAGHNFDFIHSVSNTDGSARNMETSLWTLDVHAGIVNTKPTITAHLVNCSVNAGTSFVVQEITGLAQGVGAVDGTPADNTQFGTSTSAPVPTYTSTTTDEYLLYCYGNDGAVGGTVGYPAGTAADGTNTTAVHADIGYKNSTGGTETGSWTYASANLLSGQILVAFKTADTGTDATTTATVPVAAGAATGTGTAYNPTVTTTGAAQNAPATAATGTGTAYAPSTTIKPTATAATATGTAHAPSTTVKPAAGVATATGVADNATIAVSASPAAGLASASGAANNPTVTRTGTASAGVATATATVNNPSVTRTGTATASAATATGTAYNASVSTFSPFPGPTVTERGRATSTSATIAIPISTTIAAGTVVTVRVVASNSAAGGAARTLSGIQDSRFNIYWRIGNALNDPAAVDAGVAIYTYYSLLDRGLLPGNTVSCNFAAAPTSSGAVLEEWTGVESTQMPAVDSGVASTSVTASTASGTFNPVAYGDMAVVHTGWFNAASDTFTGDADTLEGSWISLAQMKATSWHSELQYKATSGLSQQSYQGTLTGAAPSAAVVFRFRARIPPYSGAAAGTGTAYNATVSTAQSASANAGLATGSLALHGSYGATGVTYGGMGAYGGTTFDPSTGVAPTATAATSTGTSYIAHGDIAFVLPAAAIATGTAYNPTVVTGSNTVASAGAAAGTGTAYPATTTASGTAFPTTATGTGTAYNPAPAIRINSGFAAGTGTAYNPSLTASASVAAGAATGTATAFPATITTTAQPAAGVALGTTLANNPTVTTSQPALAGSATGTGTALALTATVSPTASAATATATANNATVSTSKSVAAGHAAATVTAFDATDKVSPVPTVAVATGVANQPTVITGSNQIAPAGTATATGAAANATVTTTASPNAGLATGTTTTFNATVTTARSAPAGAASATAIAFGATVTSASTATALATTATGTATAFDPTTTRTGTPAAGLAAATAAAFAPSTKVTLGASTATATGAAIQPSVVTGSNQIAPAGSASATGTAFNSVITTTARPNAGLATATGTAYPPFILAARSAPAGAATATGVAFNTTVTSASTATANAGLAAATGNAFQPSITASSFVAAGLATATGVAHQASATTASVTNVAAQTAFATGLAFQPSITATSAANAGLIAVTGVALNPTITVRAVVGVATASGAANQASATIRVNAQPAFAIGAGFAPSTIVAPTAQAAIAAGVAYQPVVISSVAGIAQIWIVLKVAIYKRNQKVSVLETSRQQTRVQENRQKITVLENRQKLTVEERRNRITVKEGEDVPRT